MTILVLLGAWLAHAGTVHPVMGTGRIEAYIMPAIFERLDLNFYPDLRSMARAKHVGVFGPRPKVDALFLAPRRDKLLNSDFHLGGGNHCGLGADNEPIVIRVPRPFRVVKLGRKIAVRNTPVQIAYEIHGWGLATVLPCELEAAFKHPSFFVPIVLHRYPVPSDVGAKLATRGIASDPIGMKRKADRSQNTKEAKPTEPSGECCPPSGLFSGVGCLPLGAQIVIALILGGAAG